MVNLKVPQGPRWRSIEICQSDVDDEQTSGRLRTACSCMFAVPAQTFQYLTSAGRQQYRARSTADSVSESGPDFDT